MKVTREIKTAKLKKTGKKSVDKEQKNLTVKIKLPKKLEQSLTYLESISGKPKEFIFYEALVQYIEDMEDIQKLSVLEVLEKGKKQKTYTTEELNKELGI